MSGMQMNFLPEYITVPSEVPIETLTILHATTFQKYNFSRPSYFSVGSWATQSIAIHECDRV